MARKKAASSSAKPAASKRATKKAAPTGKPPVPESMAEMESAWASARQHAPAAMSNEPPDIPDGNYLVQVQSARTGMYKTGKKKGTRYFNTNYVVQGLLMDEGDGSASLDVQYAGERIRSQDDLDNERTIGQEGRTPMIMFVERLQRMGIEPPESLSGLPVLAKNLGDPNHEDGKMYLTVAIRNTHKGPDPTRTFRPEGDVHYQAVYANERWPSEQAEEFIAEFMED